MVWVVWMMWVYGSNRVYRIVRWLDRMNVGMHRRTNCDWWDSSIIILDNDVQDAHIPMDTHELSLVESKAVLERRKAHSINRNGERSGFRSNGQAKLLTLSDRRSTLSFFHAPRTLHPIIPDDAILIRSEAQVKRHKVLRG